MKVIVALTPDNVLLVMSERERQINAVLLFMQSEKKNTFKKAAFYSTEFLVTVLMTLGLKAKTVS